MMIFYDKDTGEINGTVQGRFHSTEEKKLWIGSKERNGRIVYEWVSKDNSVVPPLNITEDEKRLLREVETDSFATRKYKVDLVTGRIKRKSEAVIQFEEKTRNTNKIIKKQKTPREILNDLNERVEKLEMYILKKGDTI